MNKPERIGDEMTAGEDTAAMMLDLGRKARAAAAVLALASREDKDAALRCGAAALRASADDIIAANALDLAAAKEAGRPDAFIDRLALDAKRVEGIAAGLEAIAELDDPVGATIADWRMPNKLKIERVRTPLGVIGVIYESRPNVTADAGGLCLKAGNAAILRGGSESIQSVSVAASERQPT